MELTMTSTDAKSARGWVLILTSVASFMVALDALVVTTALTTIRHDLGASIEALEWTVSAYNLPFAVLLLTGAALADRFGRRATFATGLAIFVGGSVACALAGNAGWLIAARVLQGIGAALVAPVAMALLSAAFPRDQRAKALGIFSGITGVALIAGPLVGGALVEGLSWQWIFWLNIPIGLVAIPLALSRIDESFGPRVGLDVPGVVLATSAAFGLVWGLMRGASAGWTSPEIVGSLIMGVALAAAFVAAELRTREPMLPMRLFALPAISSSVAAAFLFHASMYGVLFLLPQFLQTGQGHGPLAAGLRLLPWTATLFVFAPIGGALVNRLGERRLIVGGLLLQAAGFALVAMTASPDAAYLKLVLPLIVAGAGVSLAMPATQSATISAVAASEIGKASGTYNMFRFLGGVSGIAIAGTVFAETGGFGSAQAFTAGFTTAAGVSAVLSLAAAIVGLRLPGHQREASSLPVKASA
jgi:EmrB/QacA subfamily drug resistance transporter